MGFLDKLLNKIPVNKKPKEKNTEAKFYQMPNGETIKDVNGVRVKPTAEEKRQIEEGKISPEMWSTSATKEKDATGVPQPGEIFDVEGKRRTINKAGVVVRPTKEQLKAAAKKEKKEKE